MTWNQGKSRLTTELKEKAQKSRQIEILSVLSFSAKPSSTEMAAQGESLEKQAQEEARDSKYVQTFAIRPSC